MKKEMPLFFIFTLLCFFFFYLFNIGLAIIFFILAVPLASVAISIINSPIPTKSLGKILIIMSFAICLAALSTNRIWHDEHSFFWGLSPKKIEIIQGQVIADSVQSQNNYQSFQLKLTHVLNKDKSIKAQARGHIQIIADSDINYFMGEQLEIHSKAIQNPDSSWIIFSKQSDIKKQAPVSQLLNARMLILENLINQIDKNFKTSAALFKALFLGIKNDMPPDTLQGFQDSGTLHLLALSGLHVGIIYLAILLITKIIPIKSLRFITATLAILFYLFLIGPRPSLFRASIMIILFALGTQIKRESDRFSIVSLSALLILLINPKDCLSLSFQFSYSAISGIIIFAPFITHKLKKYLPNFLSSSLSVSLAAQWMVSPLLIFNFEYINLFGILYTLILTPLITIVIWLGMALLALSYFLPDFILIVINWIIETIWALIKFLLSPAHVLPGINISFHFPFLLIYGIVCIYLLLERYGIKIKNLRNQYES